ncbi:TIGR00725 family protein [Solwaraspora sp. WMMB335]|uniref:TIGR00725 family protein n=1 Tax=Solwaraspora sp. WMMB335 TaxID=3404118 RepID=UPI003B965A70
MTASTAVESNRPMPAYVAVIGPGDAATELERLAYRVGELLADAGAVLISGGRGGVMRASCAGAASRGGQVVGLLPGPDRAQGNEFLTVSLPTGLSEMRNFLVVNAADAVIAIGGGWGTLSEIALAQRAGKPLVALTSWTVSQPGMDVALRAAATPEDATAQVLAWCASSQ